MVVPPEGKNILGSAKRLPGRAFRRPAGYFPSQTHQGGRSLMHLFDYLDSGNGYKVRLLLAQIGQKYDWTNVDIDRG